MGDGGKKDAKSLVSSILSQVGSPRANAEPGVPDLGDLGAPDAGAARSLLSKLAPEAPVDLGSTEALSTTDPETLIEVYFELESPDERDALLEELFQNKAEVVTEFLKAVLVEDEDDYVRAQAASELARRGVAEGVEAIEADLDDPDEPYFFENALKTLCEIRGVGFYETLRAMWLDPERDGDVRRDVMLGMEILDLERAMNDFLWLIEQSHTIDDMQDDQIEVAMMAFVRHDERRALPLLQALRERILAAAIDPDEQAELAEFVQEGIDLLLTPAEE